ncbi:MAG: DUF488 domain-containing protein [Planctomycetes bacterium]|nr:DUF488 domain-containing protein [Planctomycetota bacterium]
MIDVRRWPQSRRDIWANRGRLEEALGDRYQWEGALGNRREAAAGIWLQIDPDAANAALRRLQRRMEQGQRVALLCAERRPDGCHRVIIAGRCAPRTIHIP